MNIVLLTNTYTPHVGGVARSVSAFATQYRARGHRVLVVAPEFPDMPPDETDVFRVPALQRFNASDFSVALPLPSGLTEWLTDFEPDIIHSQHPFLLGMTAVRLARYYDVPLVFTHHTLYEQYTHYVPGDSPLLKRFVIELATRYANLSDQVFAPSESIRDLLLERGVKTPVRVVPTGVDVESFRNGDGAGFRKQHGIPAKDFVVGHMGRLAPEKNLDFLARSVAAFMHKHPDARFLLVGSGPSQTAIKNLMTAEGLANRLTMTGVLQGSDLTDALHAMDVFAFASHTETQGMVLTEAMTCALPVVALDASGVREVVRDKHNGRLLPREDTDAFAEALAWVAEHQGAQRKKLADAALATAERYSMERCSEEALACYTELARSRGVEDTEEEKAWEHVMGLIKTQWEIIKSVTQAGDEALSEGLFKRDKKE